MSFFPCLIYYKRAKLWISKNIGGMKMGNVYDDNTRSKHGPWGEKQSAPGPWGGKDNMKNASVSFPGEKQVKPRPKQ
jgi:hypothetical protein